MSAQPHQTAASAGEIEGEESQQETQPQTYEDKLIRSFSEEQLSSQSALAQQVLMAGAFTGVLYCREVIQAYNFLKKPLDPEKLLTDPQYKAWAERATQLVSRREGKKRIESGKSKYSETIPKTQKALERVNATHSKLKSDKSLFLTNKSAYLTHIQTIYGFDEKQMKLISSGAWERIRERPTLSMNEALRIEAESLSIRQVRQVRQEVEKDSQGKRLTRQEKEKEVQRRFEEKREKFEKAAEKWINYEQKVCGSTIENGITQTTEALGLPQKPKEVSVAGAGPEESFKGFVPPPKTPPQPTYDLSQLSGGFAEGAHFEEIIGHPTPQPTPLSSVSLPVSPTPSVPSSLSIPLPSKLKTSISSFFPNISSFFGSKGLGGVLGKLGGFSFGKLGGNLALKLGLNAIPGIGTAASIALSIADQFPFVRDVIDITKKTVITVLALLVVGSIMAVIMFVVSIGQSGNTIPVFSQKDALIVSLNTRILSWQEFEKKYLTTSSSTWREFEIANLTPKKHLLTKNK